MAAIKCTITLILFSLYSLKAIAAVLPEERTDILFHSYEGGGVTVDGPSLLVRKNFDEKISVYGNLYQDFVTSASIDVLTSGSPYTEQRNEYSTGLEFLNDRTILSLGYTKSDESDYEAETINFSASQEFFGDLTTVTMGYAFGDDTVRNNFNNDFEESANRKRFNLGFSQILTRNILVSSSYEVVLDEGFLNNPYRQVRYLSETNTEEFTSEIYPETRNSSAFAQRAIFYISPLDASVRLEYRQYSDSWDIESKNIEIRYTQNLDNALSLELRTRRYDQTQASFYSDLFDSEPIEGQFLARDKELSQYQATQFGWTLTYTINSRLNFLNNSTLNLSWDRFVFEYDNFRNREAGDTVGEEPFYNLRADVIRLYFSSFF